MDPVIGNQVLLPPLKSEPSYLDLHRALLRLAIKPDSWGQDGQSQEIDSYEATIIRQYLLRIISSDLSWLERDVHEEEAARQRDEIWDLASKRTAERCGRTAMPEMVRTWIIPPSAADHHPALHFEIREPPLTGDNLGLKTWGTAFIMAKKIGDIGRAYIPCLSAGLNKRTESPSRPQVLELGSGTGLVGIAAAAVWKADVLLTDLADIQSNLLHNVNTNSRLVEELGGKISVATLDWSDATQALSDQRFEIIIAADPMYDDEHPDLVASMIKKYLKPTSESLALVAIPLRDKNTRALARKFIACMRQRYLYLLHQGEEICRDDWIDQADEGVRCWWSIWACNLSNYPP